MDYQFVRVRAAQKQTVKHRGKFVTGDIIVVSDAEMASFGDKFNPSRTDGVVATPEAMELMHRFLVRAQDVEASGAEGRITKPDVLASFDSDQKAAYAKWAESEA